MEKEKKDARVDLLTKIGEEVYEYLNRLHIGEGGDPDEIVFRRDKLIPLVEKYDKTIEAYRRRHIPNLGLVDADKIAAFTGAYVMREYVFESKTQQANTIWSRLANETFAVRLAQLFVRKNKFGFKPAHHQQLVFCFTNCHEHDDCLETWAVAAMALHLDHGTIQEPVFAD